MNQTPNNNGLIKLPKIFVAEVNLDALLESPQAEIRKITGKDGIFIFNAEIMKTVEGDRNLLNTAQ